jgi:hypothetical protein
MRKLRVLAADNPPEFEQLLKLQAQTAQRFEPSTAVNNREPLFWSALERARFERVLNEARELHSFALYGLRFSGPTVSFFIKPVNGFQLPEIMQWVKQTFAVRYNVMKRLDGHVWGDRYWSKVLEGEAPVEGSAAKEGGRGEELAVEEAGGEIPEARSREGPPGSGDSHHAGETAGNNGPPPDLPRRSAL